MIYAVRIIPQVFFYLKSYLDAYYSAGGAEPVGEDVPIGAFWGLSGATPVHFSWSLDDYSAYYSILLGGTWGTVGNEYERMSYPITQAALRAMVAAIMGGDVSSLPAYRSSESKVFNINGEEYVGYAGAHNAPLRVRCKYEVFHSGGSSGIKSLIPSATDDPEYFETIINAYGLHRYTETPSIREYGNIEWELYDSNGAKLTDGEVNGSEITLPDNGQYYLVSKLAILGHDDFNIIALLRDEVKLSDISRMSLSALAYHVETTSVLYKEIAKPVALSGVAGGRAYYVTNEYAKISCAWRTSNAYPIDITNVGAMDLIHKETQEGTVTSQTVLDTAHIRATAGEGPVISANEYYDIFEPGVTKLHMCVPISNATGNNWDLNKITIKVKEIHYRQASGDWQELTNPNDYVINYAIPPSIPSFATDLTNIAFSLGTLEEFLGELGYSVFPEGNPTAAVMLIDIEIESELGGAVKKSTLTNRTLKAGMYLAVDQDTVSFVPGISGSNTWYKTDIGFSLRHPTLTGAAINQRNHDLGIGELRFEVVGQGNKYAIDRLTSNTIASADDLCHHTGDVSTTMTLSASAIDGDNPGVAISISVMSQPGPTIETGDGTAYMGWGGSRAAARARDYYPIVPVFTYGDMSIIEASAISITQEPRSVHIDDKIEATIEVVE